MSFFNCSTKSIGTFRVCATISAGVSASHCVNLEGETVSKHPPSMRAVQASTYVMSATLSDL